MIIIVVVGLIISAFPPVLPLTSCSQVPGVPLGGLGRGQLGAVLRSGRPVDDERAAGGHAGHRGDGAAAARAHRLLPAAGGQRPAGGQRGPGAVDGDGPVANHGTDRLKEGVDHQTVNTQRMRVNSAFKGFAGPTGQT